MLRAKCDGKNCNATIGELDVVAYAGEVMAPKARPEDPPRRIAKFDAIVPDTGWNMVMLPNGRRKLYCDACVAAYHAKFADLDT